VNRGLEAVAKKRAKPTAEGEPRKEISRAGVQASRPLRGLVEEFEALPVKERRLRYKEFRARATATYEEIGVEYAKMLDKKNQRRFRREIKAQYGAACDTLLKLNKSSRPGPLP
jgi:hypothetical protein